MTTTVVFRRSRCTTQWSQLKEATDDLENFNFHGQLLLGLLRATPWSYDVSLPAAPGNDHSEKQNSLHLLRQFYFLPHPQPWVRVQHPTQPVGLADGHVRPPLCFGKEWADRFALLKVNPFEKIWRWVSNFSVWCKCKFSCFYVTMFLICDDVRSEYMSTHVRIDSSRFVGFLPS